MGVYLKEGSFKFTKSTSIKGSLKLTLIATNGVEETQEGDYEVLSNGKIIDIEGDDYKLNWISDTKVEMTYEYTENGEQHDEYFLITK